MPKTDQPPADVSHESIHEQYVLDVRVVEVDPPDADGPRYRFEAPQHRGIEFEDPATAELYADVYFCTNGFEEAGTGDRGVPPEVIGAGRAVLASYFLTQPGIDRDWVASFFGRKPQWVGKWVSVVEERAAEIREGAEERGL
jgi:hypothetical protein